MPAEFKYLESIDDFEELLRVSDERPVTVYKHSATCGISAHLLEEMMAVDGNVNVVVVQRSRELSDHIARKSGIRHQSPQAFVFRDRKVRYQASHYAINPSDINKNLKQ